MIKENYLSYPAAIKEAMGLQVDWQSKDPTPPVPEGFVDFGLPSGTLWSTKNIGAINGNTAESWYGNYYAWGETETKEDYSWETYKYANSTYDKLTKYCNHSGYGNEGYTDELTQLVPVDDVATATNSAWRMPTKENFEELLAGTSNNLVENYNNIEGLNGRVFIKATIIQPSFKNITLYSPVAEGEVTDEIWAQISTYTLEEMNASLGGDIRTMIFKDAEMSILAEYNIDYGFVKKETDPSVSMFIPAAGYCAGSDISDGGSKCYLWSSSLRLDGPSSAHDLTFSSDGIVEVR